MLKKGDQVKILRKESYWYQDIGSVAAVDSGSKYGVLVRFKKFNYNSVNANSFAENELMLIEK